MPLRYATQLQHPQRSPKVPRMRECCAQCIPRQRQLRQPARRAQHPHYCTHAPVGSQFSLHTIRQLCRRQGATSFQHASQTHQTGIVQLGAGHIQMQEAMQMLALRAEALHAVAPQLALGQVQMLNSREPATAQHLWMQTHVLELNVLELRQHRHQPRHARQAVLGVEIVEPHAEVRQARQPVRAGQTVHETGETFRHHAHVPEVEIRQIRAVPELQPEPCKRFYSDVSVKNKVGETKRLQRVPAVAPRCDARRRILWRAKVVCQVERRQAALTGEGGANNLGHVDHGIRKIAREVQRCQVCARCQVGADADAEGGKLGLVDAVDAMDREGGTLLDRGPHVGVQFRRLQGVGCGEGAAAPEPCRNVRAAVFFRVLVSQRDRVQVAEVEAAVRRKRANQLHRELHRRNIETFEAEKVRHLGEALHEPWVPENDA